MVKTWGKFAFGILFDTHHKKEEYSVSQQFNMFLIDQSPQSLFIVVVVKPTSDLHDVLGDRTLLNFEFRQT